MPASPLYTVPDPADGKTGLPLQAFFTSLQQNGFGVTPEQIVDANRIISYYAPLVKGEGELCRYLSPLFARNQDEQLQFEEIFHAHFTPRVGVPVKEAAPFKKYLKRFWWIGVTMVVAGIALSAVYQFSRKPALAYHPSIYLHDKNDSVKEKYGKGSFQVSRYEQLEVYTETQYPEPDSSQQIRLHTTYDWGDHTRPDTVSIHTYTSDGVFKLTAYTDVYYKSAFQHTDTLTETVKVCSSNNSLVLQKAARPGFSGAIPDSLKTEETITLQAVINGEAPSYIWWTADGKTLGDGKELNISFAQVGRQKVSCYAVYDTIESPCTMHASIVFSVYDPNRPLLKTSISRAVEGDPLSPVYKVKPFWFYLVGALCLLFFIPAVFLARRKKRREKKREQSDEQLSQTYNSLLRSFSGKKYPAELPFQSKNYLPVPEADLYEAATRMRRRLNENARYLHIGKTIRKSISNRGYFEPVYAPRLQQSEYLVLIDAGHNNNQQVKLFDYLIDILRKQNVSIEKYYYRYEPKLCYNSLEPQGVSLEKLSGKYEGSVLLIFGHAYQLLYPYYPVFNNEYLPLLDRWPAKAVLTPVSFPDWGSKETAALLPQLPVVPVDAEGMLMLMEALFAEEYDLPAALKRHRRLFYPVASVDFENTDELRAYCDRAVWARTQKDGNILFQWIAALCVYPKIKWEITLAIGKAILDKYGIPQELNFSNLLRIARIKWMKDGQFPDYTRLDLLKELTVENEAAARETILSMLKEIPAGEMDERHFAYEEKEIQRISNEFILYAYDPVKYAAFRESKELYERLWKEGKITDAPSKIYFKNEDAAWSTPIGEPQPADGGRNVSIDAYFQPEEKAATGRVYASVMITSSVLFLLSLIGFILLGVLHVMHTNRFPTFVYALPVNKDVRFNLVGDVSKINSNRLELFVDGTSMLYYQGNWNKPFLLPIDDTAKSVSIRFDLRYIFDTSMQVNYNAYDVLVSNDTGSRKNRPDTVTVPAATEKPLLYIQYNNRQAARKAAALMACINGGLFAVPGIEYKADSKNFYRNEIRFYKSSFSDSISLLQSCLRSVYPGRRFYPVAVPGRKSRASAEIWIYDSLKADTPGPANDLPSKSSSPVQQTIPSSNDGSLPVRTECDTSTNSVELPTAFTPGKSINNYFKPLGLYKSNPHILSFRVYSRWGSIVYEVKDVDVSQIKGWDGGAASKTTQGTETFVWMLEMKCSGKLITKKGTVLLIR